MMSDIQLSYYDILNVKMNAPISEIKQAYLKQIKKWHPDHNKSPGACEHTQKIIEAWEVLGNPHRRAQYDAMLAQEVIIERPPEWISTARKRAKEKAQRPLKDLLKEIGQSIIGAVIAWSFILLFVAIFALFMLAPKWVHDTVAFLVSAPFVVFLLLCVASILYWIVRGTIILIRLLSASFCKNRVQD